MPLAPPPYTEVDNTVQNPSSEVPRFEELTEEEIKRALVQFVSDTCCYGKGPIDRIAIKGIEMKSSFHLSLASFTESRQTKWVSVPYSGKCAIV